MSDFEKIRKMGVRLFLVQCLNFAAVLASGLMIWKGLGLVCNTESPIVVVLSGSMEPAMYRGDLLFLTNPPNTPYILGDITVYKVPAGDGNEIPIVHRVIESHTKTTGVQLMLTKGDNNPTDDIGLYGGVPWLYQRDIVGKVRGYLPYVGYATIAMNDFPWLKYALMGTLALLALVQRE